MKTTTPKPATCPGCREPLERIVWCGIIPASQPAAVDPIAGGVDWETTETHDGGESTAFYTSECCDRLLPAATVARFAVPTPNPAARRLMPPTAQQLGK